MSRPSITTPPRCPVRRCSATSTRRTPETTAIFDAACDTSGVRIAIVTSSWSRKISCVPSVARKSICVSQASVSRSSSRSNEIPFRNAFRASARYIAPVSTYTYAISSATRRASVLLPEPTGPSIAMISFFISRCGPGSNPFKCALDFAYRVAQHHRSAVWAAHRVLGLGQFAEQPFHLLRVERRIYFDRRVARRGSRNLRLQRIDRDGLVLARDTVENFE